MSLLSSIRQFYSERAIGREFNSPLKAIRRSLPSGFAFQSLEDSMPAFVHGSVRNRMANPKKQINWIDPLVFDGFLYDDVDSVTCINCICCVSYSGDKFVLLAYKIHDVFGCQPDNKWLVSTALQTSITS